VRGVINSTADLVMATRTSAPAFARSRVSSAHLYAAIPPVMPKITRLLVRLNMGTIVKSSTLIRER